ncbi:sarcosine oxidase subunit gamma [Pseudooctadecabacter jejudonensis]|uniref:Sarcosine oxidase, gamma subunit family n=1 Tax=Pseudooctadecabacter jejudonensis TaxID=1391910 RepID=A0A1Y5SGQ4_9RHOB|nr:sarcosine oxidase subunit gamma [Pseudooctadecabacter jejudonensis]SLN40081.1 Sarcosine oxidase, gamma subunit family [Pseudooctadecabacter jejudonensis]
MAKLIETTPCAGLLPLSIGGVNIHEINLGQVTLVAPYAGGAKATSDALKAAIGVTFPKPNRTNGAGPRAIWCGLDQALIVGGACPDLPQAAVVDHSDAWAVVRIEGAEAEAVLARLVPADLRASVFKRGHTVRTMLVHMNVGITRVGASAFEVMAMRSMAGTLVHDLEQAAKGVAARALI